MNEIPPKNSTFSLRSSLRSNVLRSLFLFTPHFAVNLTVNQNFAADIVADKNLLSLRTSLRTISLRTKKACFGAQLCFAQLSVDTNK